jgi:hypothetical protein
MFGFLKKKQPASAPIPSAEAEPERYKGRPLLIILENYILSAIDQLPQDKCEVAAQLVQATFGGDKNWMQTIRKELALNDSIDESLRQLWANNQSIAKQNSMTLQPVQFAKMIADQNFANLIDTPKK